MSFHPNEVARRGRVASGILIGMFLLLGSAFFRAQVLQNAQYTLQSEGNRLREVPLPAQRGTILDVAGRVIAEDVPGYSVSILSPREDSLRAALVRLSGTITLGNADIEAAVRRFRRAPNRPTTIISDASFDVVSVLEERRVEFPSLIIQSAPKRYYPDSSVVGAFSGYTAEITEAELNQTQYRGYKAGQQVGKGGLEQQYEEELRGREGTHFVEADARGRVVTENVRARPDITPDGAPALRTSIDLELQRYVVELFGDSLQGGIVAMKPRTGEVVAIHSNPTFDPNRFIGGVSTEYYSSLKSDPRNPLYNKAIQGTYPPGSTWKLATAAVALEQGLVTPEDRMPVPCTGGFQLGNRYFRCWERKGHGNVNLTGAIVHSCDVYFYQLGLKLGLQRLVAGGLDLQFGERSGIDLPNEARPRFPYRDVENYYNRRYGPRGWTPGANTLNLSIGQGENSQTVVNMARFYTALATDGSAARPQIVARSPDRERLFTLTPKQLEVLREAMAGVTAAGGTAGSAAIQGVVLAGKTGTAQNSQGADHSWFVGFAPANDPQIVVAVMLEFGGHGYRAARIASKVIERYLKVAPAQMIETDG